MNFENPLQMPTPKEMEEIIKHYSIEEAQILYDEIGKDIAKKKEKIYSDIKYEIVSGKGNSLKEDHKQFFLDNLKEEDFELASTLNKN